MNRLSVGVGLTVLALGVPSALAETYQWQGGASGEWGDPMNWMPSSGVPNSGDTAYFASSAVVTDGFAISGGTLVITNAFNTDLTLEGVVSGAGALFKCGSGRLLLKGENTFAGGLTAIGNADVAATAGEVVAYTANALGTGPATIGTASRPSNCRLHVVGPVSIANDLTLGDENTSIRQGSLCLSGGASVAGNVQFLALAQFLTAGDGLTYRFGGPVSNTGSYLIPTLGTGDSVVFDGPISIGSWEPTGAGIFRFNAQNTFANFWPGSSSQIVCGTNDAISCSTAMKIAGTIDLNGFDQVLKAGTSSAKWKYGFDSQADSIVTSPEGKPAFLCFHNVDYSKLPVSGYEELATNFVFHGWIKGSAGICWNPAEPGQFPERGKVELVLRNHMHPTTGSLVISNGAVRVSNRCGFGSLAKIEIRNAAELRIDADSAEAGVAADALEADVDAIVSIAAGRIVTVKGCVYGETTLPPGDYTEATAGGLVVGEGILRVLPSGNMREWTGAAGNGLLSDPQNWKDGVAPEAGDNLWFDGATGNPTVNASLPEYGYVFIRNSTLKWSGWNACLNAATVVAVEGAVLTCDGPFADDEGKSRVWIDCQDFALDAGACVDVSGKGWAAGKGPGCGRAYFGASHGGTGGASPAVAANPGFPAATYGSASEPLEPGSGGCADDPGFPAGGGAVLIDAEGRVSIDGVVRASGSDVCEGYWRSDTGASGGSVLIRCHILSGRGMIRADGGNGDDPRFPKWMTDGKKHYKCPGGGGRVAVVYDDVSPDAVSGMVLSAAAGVYQGADYPISLANQDVFHDSAQMGTVWFSDSRLLGVTVGRGLSGRVVHPVGYSTDGDLVCTNGWVRFEGEGVSVSIGGDLAVSGNWARVEVGGCLLTNRAATISYTDVWAGRTPVSLTVGGSVAIADGGRLDVYAAEAASAAAWGATVSVGQNISILPGGVLAPWSDTFNGGSVCFQVTGGFTVAEGGLVNADARGYAGAFFTGWSRDHGFKSDSGRGPGGGLSKGGGGHGGKGGYVGGYDDHAGVIYDDPYEPCQPGSGGGNGGYCDGGMGGGVVHVSAGGDIVVDGRISADGCPARFDSVASGVVGYKQSGAGGTIFLSGRTFSGSGELSACGASAAQTARDNPEADAAGGGGRIAIWTGLDRSVVERYRVVRAEQGNPEHVHFSGSVSAIGGRNLFSYDTVEADKRPMPEQNIGGTGSVWYCDVQPKRGLAVIVR